MSSVVLVENYQLQTKYKQVYKKRVVNIFTREASVVIKIGLGAKRGARALGKQIEHFKFAELMQKDSGKILKRIVTDCKKILQQNQNQHAL